TELGSKMVANRSPLFFHKSGVPQFELSGRGRMELAWGILGRNWKGALAMERGREYWDIFFIAAVVVIVFGVIQAWTCLTEQHREGRRLSGLCSPAILGAPGALRFDFLAYWIARKCWGPLHGV